ncbi:hypothetical protein [Saccharomonospora cyanea]|uniref:Uncharacterized protein n=1 Tax=Saccharomonospora cyanea NA-134 TaxID=882082 RepID=H5XG69_9PSEU|nr:hypothetical protein [Saccharomonospora cyanea]EHR62651.1 hypothetical protein SaccyDRAFT_3824 [Saccharomonospora cyanea NA-134]
MSQISETTHTTQSMLRLLEQMTATLSSLQTDGNEPDITVIGTVPVLANDLVDPGADPLTPLRIEVERYPGEDAAVVISPNGWSECAALSVEGARAARDLLDQAVRVAEGTEVFAGVGRG